MVFYGDVDTFHRLLLTKATNALKNGFLESCSPGQRVKVTLTKVRPDKTKEQLGAIWGMLIPAAKQAMDQAGIDCMGVPLNQDMVKEILYKFCGGVGESGEIVPLSKQSVDQASRFFENCRNWLAETFDCHVPDPDPNWREKLGAGLNTDVAKMKAPSPGREAQPVPPLDDSHRYVCSECGLGHRVRPASGKCVGHDTDGFRCGGEVKERT